MRIAAATLLFTLFAGLQSAAAQEENRVGLVMGLPAAAGVLWHVAEGFALRPELTLARASADTVTFTLGQPSPATTTWLVGVGLSGLIYVGPRESLRTYVSPRIAYSRAETSPEQDFPATNSEFTAAGSFGAQYTIGDRFAVFGELGLSYSRRRYTSAFPVGRTESRADTVSMRSGVGVVFYF